MTTSHGAAEPARLAAKLARFAAELEPDERRRLGEVLRAARRADDDVTGFDGKDRELATYPGGFMPMLLAQPTLTPVIDGDRPLAERGK